MALPEYLLIELDCIDSTNNYAMQLIDANKAQHGMAITAQNQWAGKGQRGKTWTGEPGQSLLMTVIVSPGRAIHEQFVFSASVAVAIAKILQKLNNGWQVNIKWPNDIIVNDKKAGGVLIENTLKGSLWTNSVIGFGLNVLQPSFPALLPHAASLKTASGREYAIAALRLEIWAAIMAAVNTAAPAASVMNDYNALLWKKGSLQGFFTANDSWQAHIHHANPDGTLVVQVPGHPITKYRHGQAEWEWV